MALIWADRVVELSTTTGTGAFTLSTAITGYRRFSAVCSTSDTVYYTIEAIDVDGIPTGDWEVGLGTYSAANTLTRTSVLASSNAGAAVNFGAGTKRVMLNATAAQFSAAGIKNVPAGNIAATDVQAAINELDTEKLAVANNLSDLANAGTARTNLGLVAGGAGDVWVEKAGDTMTGPLTLQVSPSVGQMINDIIFDDNGAADTGTYRATRYSDASTGPVFFGRKARGSLATPTTVLSGDTLMGFRGYGYNGSAFVSGSSGVAFLLEAAENWVAGTSYGTQIRFFTTANGSTANSERAGITNAGEIAMGGLSNIVIDANRLHRLRQYTVATLPTVGTAGRLAAVTDANAPTYNATVAGGGAVNIPVYDNGANWTCH